MFLNIFELTQRHWCWHSISLIVRGTRDLVVDAEPGFFFAPTIHLNGSTDSSSMTFEQTAVGFSQLGSMSTSAVEEGIIGRSWGQAIDAMVDCYEEGITISSQLPLGATDILMQDGIYY
jgi:hypothetical protein